MHNTGAVSGVRRLRLVDPADIAAAEGGHMKVAFATQDMHTLDAHFAGARNFAIYDVTPEGYRLLEAVRFDSASNEDGAHAEAHEDRLTPRVDALAGCALLFVLAIGGPAAARVVSRKIHPIKLPRPEPIIQILGRVQNMLNGTPPPWLRKAVAGTQRSAKDFLEQAERAQS
jgi:nitrogen fixation protein NifX